jgi:uncharacterized protein (TIGR02145 family)
MKMIKIFHLFFWVLILNYNLSCNVNEPAVVIPIAPTGLNAVVASNTQIDLFWSDNATNETGYKIQRKIMGVDFSDLATVSANINTFSDNNVQPNITYTYRVYSFNTGGNSAQYSNEDTARIVMISVVLPTLTTNNISAIDTMNASSGGNITNDGGAPVISRGVCWSLTQTPTVDLPSKTIDANGIGLFSSRLTGLSPNTTYHVRAYATNSVGTAYGEDIVFTTQQLTVPLCGVNIAGLTWSCKNLDIAYYRNGDPIPKVSNAAEWMNTTSGAWCWYNNDSLNYSKYGKLYNWYAVDDPRGLAPAGWHVATENEWNKLIKFTDANADTVCNYCTSSQTAGGPLKTIGLINWISPNTGATNSTGFSALPGGLRSEIGNFSLARNGAYWWTANEFDTWQASYRYVLNVNATANRYYIDKRNGYSVRLVKN